MTRLRMPLLMATLLGAGIAIAKLPAPPPMDDAAKAAAEDKKAKEAAAADQGKLQQAKAEDRVAAKYIADQKAKGVTVTPQMGPTAAAVAASIAAGSPGSGTNKGVASQPLEKAQAHSDPKTVR
ncbi:MAG TPA: formate dehydrogenase [Casimicrobiaceae bacterium]|jgi:hypothetical protein